MVTRSWRGRPCGHKDATFAASVNDALAKTGVRVCGADEAVAETLGTVLLIHDPGRGMLEQVSRLSVGNRVVALARPEAGEAVEGA